MTALFSHSRSTLLPIILGGLSLQACDPQTARPSPQHMDRGLMSQDGGQHAAPHTAPGDLIPGLLSPLAYGHNSWAGLDERVRRNLSAIEMDLARLDAHQGRSDQARTHAERAVDLNLRVQGLPADDFIEGRIVGSTVPCDDERPLEQRVQSAMYDGWCGASVALLMQIEPAWAQRIGQDLLPDYPDHVGQPCASLVRYHQARDAQQRGDTSEAQRQATRAAGELLELLRDEVHAEGAELTITAGAEDWNVETLSYHHTDTASYWGWRTTERQVQQLSAYAQDAATLSGDAKLLAAVRARTAGIDTVLATRLVSLDHSARWTTVEALGRIPT